MSAEDSASSRTPNTNADDAKDLTEEEREALCRAFTLLDVNGDGVIDTDTLKDLFVSWGRLPVGEEFDEVTSKADNEGCEGARGMNFETFRGYVGEQLRDTRDEEALRSSFQVFDSSPPTGKVNLTELRHYLKRDGLKLTDDELDFLFKEEDYWMLEEKNMFEYEELISKILGKPTCQSPFLGCL